MRLCLLVPRPNSTSCCANRLFRDKRARVVAPGVSLTTIGSGEHTSIDWFDKSSRYLFKAVERWLAPAMRLGGREQTHDTMPNPQKHKQKHTN